MYINPEINTNTLRTVAGETNDCTVRALAAAADIHYSLAHLLMAKHGRKPRKGTYHETQVKAYTEAGGRLAAIVGNTKGARYRARMVEDAVPHLKGMTLKTFLESTPTGRFVCIMRGHAFAVVEGKLADAGPLRAGVRIQAIYRFD